MQAFAQHPKAYAVSSVADAVRADRSRDHGFPAALQERLSLVCAHLAPGHAEFRHALAMPFDELDMNLTPMPT